VVPRPDAVLSTINRKEVILFPHNYDAFIL